VPEGSTMPNPSKRAEAIYGGIASMKEYIDKVNAGEISKPFALRGVTPKEMAEAALRLGFKEVREVQEDEWTKEYVVVARFGDVEAALNRLLERKTPDGQNLLEKLGDRALRDVS
jgi:hypothetical protein